MHGFTDYFTATSVFAAHQANVTAVVPWVEAQLPDGQWRRIADDIGFPAGLLRTMTADLTRALPAGARRIRIWTNLKIYWDQILVDTTPEKAVPVRRTEIPLADASLAFRGFPRETTGTPAADLQYVHGEVSKYGPYARHRGFYTKYGAVTPLLDAAEDQFAIFGAGDEVALEFDASALPPLLPGWTRDYFVYFNGYVKDMDFYAAHAQTVAPLPFKQHAGISVSGSDGVSGPQSGLPARMEHARSCGGRLAELPFSYVIITRPAAMLVTRLAARNPSLCKIRCVLPSLPGGSVRLVSLAVVLLTAAALTHGAQDQAPDPPRFRVGVEAIRMDVVVTDRDGNPVTDLTHDDFEVRQDGKLQQVTLARYVPVDAEPPTTLDSRSVATSAAAPVVGGQRLTRSDVQRTIVLVVDDLGIAWINMEPTRKALRRFVAEQVRPDDLVALVKTSVNAGVGQQLTHDRRLLNAAIEQVKWNGFSRRGITSFEALNAVLPTSSGTPGPGVGANFGFDRSDPTDLGRLDQLRESMSAGGTLGMLQLAIRGVRDLPGRKAVVLISEGFELFERDPDGTYQPSLLVRDQLERVVDRAMRVGVVVYAIDPRGLQTGGLTAEDATTFAGADTVMTAGVSRRQFLLETQESLRFLAEQTGGRAMVNSNDIAQLLKRVSDDLRGYYVIGYTPPEDTFAAPGRTPRFHAVSVSVKRPGLRVRTRKGFLGVSDNDRTAPPASPQQALHDAAMSPFA